jgi:Flp pilus assembly protein TadG
MSPTFQRQRGAIAIMVALSMLVLLAAVGLVIDGGLAYLVKARLNAAVDSAALAGARAVTTGNNQTDQKASAIQAARDFFAANIPGNYLLSQPQITSINVTLDDGGTATIDVRAQAPMRVSLMQVMGFSSLSPGAYAQTIRRDLDMALVVDTSGSLDTSSSAVRSATKTFLNAFNVTQDRVALIHFAYGAVIDNPIYTSTRGFNRTSMLQNIAALNFKGATASVEGMWNARNQLNGIPASKRSTQRVIVFFSDGEPTAFGSYLTFNSPTACPYAGSFDYNGNGMYLLNYSEPTDGPGNCALNNSIPSYVRKLPDWYNAHNSVLNPNDPTAREFPIVTDNPRKVTNELSTVNIAKQNVDRASRNLVEAVAAKARDEGIIVFTLGLGADLRVPKGVDSEIGENVLKCMANVADGPARCYNPNKPVGMYCYAATTANLTPCFARLASAILRISK